MWFEHPTVKIFKETAAGTRSTYTVYLAKNEYEGCQLAVNFPEYYDNFSLTAEIASAPGGLKDTGSVSVEIYREYFVSVIMASPYVATDVKTEGSQKYYPDALAPFNGTMALDAFTTQPFYILVNAARDAAPGEYVFTLTANDGDNLIDKATLSVHVWDFTLPDASASRNVMGLGADCIADKTGLTDYQEITDMYVKYYDFLLEHHVCAYNLPYDILDDRADAYMDDPRVTAFTVPYRDDDGLKALAGKLRTKQEWLDKAFFYFQDEPGTVSDYMALVDRCAHLREIFPEAHIISPFFIDPDIYNDTDAVEYCFGSIDIWCPKLFTVDSARTSNIYSESQNARLAPLAARLRERREQNGEDFWTYVCWEPGEPYLNLYVNMPGLSHRLIFWQNYLLGANGFLYWSSNFWNQVADPWTDANTVKWLTSFVFGDGSVLYNGNKVGVDGPCGSLRLEAVRDGSDDYTYFEMLRSLGYREESIDSLVKSMTKDLTHSSSNDDMLYKVRVKAGNLIEKLSGN